jgi:hypothetical protein
MRLINTTTYEFKEFFDLPPPYAILSHTWEGQDEVLYSDMANLTKAEEKANFYKIRKTCETAAADGLAWAWVDTCCIDKSSSSELTEAINSMFTWYQQATICYAYISDLLPNQPLEDGLQNCRWLTRGWTLQELIAPRALTFFDQGWNARGEKKDLCDILSLIAGIDIKTLKDNKRLLAVPVARRMSWAASRTTTRIEDMAYCLLGIFGVNMPMLYGEGEKAFTRLQHEIIRSTNDLSLFAWKWSLAEGTPLSIAGIGSGILARAPSNFAHCRNLTWISESRFSGEFSITNNGLRISNLLKLLPSSMPRSYCNVLPLNCAVTVGPDKKKTCIGIYLFKYGPSLYARAYFHELCLLPDITSTKPTTKIGYVRFNKELLRNMCARSKPTIIPRQDEITDAPSVPSSTIGRPNRNSIITPQAVEPLYILLDSRGLPFGPAFEDLIIFQFQASRDLMFFPASLRVDPESDFDHAFWQFLPPKSMNFLGMMKIPDLEGLVSLEDIYVVCGVSPDHQSWCAVRKGRHDTNGQPDLGRNRIEDISYAEIIERMERLGYPKTVSIKYQAHDGTMEKFEITVILSSRTKGTFIKHSITVSFKECRVDNIH